MRVLNALEFWCDRCKSRPHGHCGNETSALSHAEHAVRRSENLHSPAHVLSIQLGHGLRDRRRMPRVEPAEEVLKCAVLRLCILRILFDVTLVRKTGLGQCDLKCIVAAKSEIPAEPRDRRDRDAALISE